MSNKAYTPHGEVEYDTVTCVSCGNEVAADSADDVVVGNITKHQYSYSDDRLEFSSGYARGHVCEFCQPEPASFPTNSADRAFQWFIRFVLVGMNIIFALTALSVI